MSVRCFNSVVGNPTSVALDNTKDYCSISTLFSDVDVSTLKKWQLRLLPFIDSVCTVTIEISNILLWYAVDEILLMILPAYPQVSKLSQCLQPLGLGLLSGTLAFYGQMVIVCFVDGLTGEGLRPLNGISWRRKVTDWLLSGMGMLSSVLHWYGLWTLLDYFFLPNLPKLSNIITAIFGILGMCLTGASRCLTHIFNSSKTKSSLLGHCMEVLHEMVILMTRTQSSLTSFYLSSTGLSVDTVTNTQSIFHINEFTISLSIIFRSKFV